MEVAILAVKYLGTALISLTIGFVVCFLAVLGYNTYIRFHNKDKKIEVSGSKQQLQSKDKKIEVSGSKQQLQSKTDE